jgi:hypothetical protein
MHPPTRMKSISIQNNAEVGLDFADAKSKTLPQSPAGDGVEICARLLEFSSIKNSTAENIKMQCSNDQSLTTLEAVGTLGRD